MSFAEPENGTNALAVIDSGAESSYATPGGALGRFLDRLVFDLKVAYRAPTRVRNFPLLVLNELGLLPSGMSRVRLRGGLAFDCRNRTSDFAAVVSVAVTEGYSRRPVTEIRKGGVVLDLGGHIGTFAVLLHRLRPDLTIFTVEPSVENCELLRRNLGLNGVGPQVVPVRGAVAGFDGVARLRGNGGTDAWYVERLAPEEEAPNAMRVCRMATLLSQLGGARVDFIKMDIEGAEYEVLLDSPDIVRGCQGVALEFHRRVDGVLKYPDGERFVRDYFRSLDFRVTRLGLDTIYAAPRG